MSCTTLTWLIGSVPCERRKFVLTDIEKNVQYNSVLGRVNLCRPFDFFGKSRRLRCSDGRMQAELSYKSEIIGYDDPLQTVILLKWFAKIIVALHLFTHKHIQTRARMIHMYLKAWRNHQFWQQNKSLSASWSSADCSRSIYICAIISNLLGWGNIEGKSPYWSTNSTGSFDLSEGEKITCDSHEQDIILDLFTINLIDCFCGPEIMISL